MRFFIQINDSKKLYYKKGESSPAKYANIAVAKAIATQLGKKDSNDQYGAIREDKYYELYPVKKVVKKNLLSGKDFLIDEDAPACCDPSSEVYWSM